MVEARLRVELWKRKEKKNTKKTTEDIGTLQLICGKTCPGENNSRLWHVYASSSWEIVKIVEHLKLFHYA